MSRWGGNISTKCAVADYFGEEAGGFQFTSQYALPQVKRIPQVRSAQPERSEF